MKILWQKYQVWRNARRRMQIAAWKETRAKGAGRFIVLNAVAFGLIMVIVIKPLSGYLFSSKNMWDGFWIDVIVYPMGALVMWSVLWQARESAYEKFSKTPNVSDPADSGSAN